MKKLFLTLALTAICSMSALAVQNWGGYFVNAPTCVQLSVPIDNGDLSIPHRGGTPQPELAYEVNTFVLAVPYEMEDVVIIIRDANGDELYYDNVLLITDYYMFQVSNTVLSNKASVEIYHGSSCWYGEF